MGGLVDMAGKRIGMLTVISRGCNNKDNRVTWICECDCGKTTIINGKDLRKKNNTKSCGCLQPLTASMLNSTHRMRKTGLYESWANAKTRCYNRNSAKYYCYGGRGIKMCDEWKNNFISFMKWSINNGWEAGLTIDRIDNNGDYTPDNCQWLTRSENSRKSNANRGFNVNN